MSRNKFRIAYFQSTTGASSPRRKGSFTLKRNRTIFTFRKIFFRRFVTNVINRFFNSKLIT